MTIRSDKKKSLDKTAASLIKNPLQSERQLAESVWLWNGTVHRAKVELERSGAIKDDRIKSLTDKDFKCIQLGVLEIERRLSDKTELEKMRTPEISQVIKENTARYTLFSWEATDDKWGLKDATAIEKLNSVIGSE